MKGERVPSTDVLRSPDGSVEVEVVPELGARLHRLRAFGRELLRTPPDPAVHAREPFFWGGYVMAPWCNRLETSPTAVGDRTVDLPSNFSDGTAIHGQVYLRPWDRVGAGRYRIAGGGDGWPWDYEVELGVEPREAALAIELTLTNRSGDRMPGGVGLHPWFRRPVLLAIHGDAVHPSNLDTEPRPRSVAGAFDLRSIGEPAIGLDATWTDLPDPADPAAELRWADADLAAALRMRSDAGRFVVAATPPDIDAVAVEPETHAPQGLRRLLHGEPGGLVWLEPDTSLALRVELAFERS
jgi:aldose 1-epimerase